MEPLHVLLLWSMHVLQLWSSWQALILDTCFFGIPLSYEISQIIIIINVATTYKELQTSWFYANCQTHYYSIKHSSCRVGELLSVENAATWLWRSELAEDLNFCLPCSYHNRHGVRSLGHQNDAALSGLLGALYNTYLPYHIICKRWNHVQVFDSRLQLLIIVDEIPPLTTLTSSASFFVIWFMVTN